MASRVQGSLRCFASEASEHLMCVSTFSQDIQEKEVESRRHHFAEGGAARLCHRRQSAGLGESWEVPTGFGSTVLVPVEGQEVFVHNFPSALLYSYFSHTYLVPALDIPPATQPSMFSFPASLAASQLFSCVAALFSAS